jgi:hypothetical protein
VFSAQRGGLRTRRTPATVSGNTLAFTPSDYPFLPGETVQYTLTTAAVGSGGAVTQPRVGQFTTAVGTGNTGIFAKTAATPPPVPAQYYASSVALGDVDADGDVDLLIGGNGRVNVRLNDGLGHFSGTQEVLAGGLGYKILLGDLDNDGDLDLLASGGTTNVVSVRLNDGQGTFSNGQDVTLPGAMFNLALGDVEGDGDLDLVVANTNGASVSVRLNDGSGNFTGGSEVPTVSAWDVALGDVDNDGDLDLLVLNNLITYPTTNGTLNVYLNSGNGTFSSSQAIATGASPWQVVLGDVDQDGDLDLLVNSVSNKPISLYRNDGTGTFGSGQSIFTYNYRAYTNLTLADVEGDGDLDMLLAIQSILTPPPLIGGGTGWNQSWFTTIKLVNDGAGGFTAAETINVGDGPHNVAVGDVNGDGGLDFVTSDYYSRTATVCLNGRSAALATRPGQGSELALFPNPAHRTLTLSGAPAHARVQVLDILGRVVHTDIADGTGTTHLALPIELPAGSYLVRSGGQVRRLTLE